MTRKTYNAVGVMSGTSLDGIDLCWAEFSKKEAWSFRILAAETLLYSEDMKARLSTSIALKADQLNQFNYDYTKYLGCEINNFIQKHSIINLDAVCSHGHTVFHQPEKGLTLQIGNLPQLADYIQQTLVCDFRAQDVAMGGQGAPLVPVGDAFLFSEYDFCLNLGGFANISFQKQHHRLAFDICPANLPLNHYVKSLGFAYDEGGVLAAQGTLNEPLLAALNRLDFYKKQPPKSLGLEWLKCEVYPLLDQCGIDINSILRTLVEHTAIQISDTLKQNKLSKGLYTGGGVLNTFLLARIGAHVGYKIQVSNLDLVHYKEALIFGFLGVLKLRNEVNCLQSVTGASKDHSSGEIYLPTKY